MLAVCIALEGKQHQFLRLQKDADPAIPISEVGQGGVREVAVNQWAHRTNYTQRVACRRKQKNDFAQCNPFTV